MPFSAVSLRRVIYAMSVMVIIGGGLFSLVQIKNFHTIFVDDVPVRVVIADESSEHMQGLSGTSLLEKGTGMLFVFDELGYYGFWMKDMKYPLDMFWFDDEGVLVHEERNVTPATFPQVFGGEIQSQYILETNVGELISVKKLEREKRK